MRGTQLIAFLNSNPTKEEEAKYTHADLPSLKKRFKSDKDFATMVRKSRKRAKEINTGTETVDIFEDLEE